MAKKKLNGFLFSRKRAQVYYFNIWWVFDVRHSWDIFPGFFVVYFCVFFLTWRSSNVKLSVISVSEEIKKHQKMVCRVGIKGLWAEITVGVSFTTVARRQWWNFILTCIVKRYSFTTVAVVKLIQPFRMAKIRVCYSLRYVYEEMRYFFVRVKNYY